MLVVWIALPQNRRPPADTPAFLVLVAGGVIGNARTTCYAFAWLVVPVSAFVLWRGGNERRLVLLLLVTVAVLSAPGWCAQLAPVRQPSVSPCTRSSPTRESFAGTG